MKKKTCDMCGKEFTDASYPVVDENFKKQKGLKQCGCMFDTPGQVKNLTDEDYSEYHLGAQQ